MHTQTKDMPGFQCSTCNVALNSQDQYAQHMQGKSHLKKIANKGLENTNINQDKGNKEHF